MSIFHTALREREQRLNLPADQKDTDVQLGGASVSLDDAETTQSSEETWLTGAAKYGRPRGREAYEAREISQTWAMELITNGIVDQLTSGDLAFEQDGDDVDDATAEFQALVRDILNGPHLQDDDLDDLIAAAVGDMVGPAHAYWEAIPAADGSLPVAALKPVDALTVRHNIDQTGTPKDPPYFQGAFNMTNGTSTGLASMSPTPLESDQLVVMRYPGSKRSYQIYPKSPAMQVRETLKLLADSTTHHNRYYSDNEIPAGFLQIMQAGNQDLEQIRGKLQQAAGDPRSMEVIGGDGAAQWIEMGGTSINLNVIEEQKWFLQLCLASFGLGKAEIGLIEDVNRANGEAELTRVFKRVTKPFAKTIGQAITRQILPQFDAYQALDTSFSTTLRFSDPARERSREEHLRQRFQAGGLTLRDYRQALGEDVGDEDLSVEIGGQEIDYGDHPKFVVEQLLREARSDPAADEAEEIAEHLEDDAG